MTLSTAELQERLKRQKAAEAAKAVAKPEPIKAAAPVVEDGIEEETVAVIMAAISAMSSAEGKKPVLKSVKLPSLKDLHGLQLV